MDLGGFKKILRLSDAKDIAEEALYRDIIYAIANKTSYSDYLKKIREDYAAAEHVAIMGSGNWCYSLNPDKNFRPFNAGSDIDVVIICPNNFHATWEELRKYHRKDYYLLSDHEKKMLRRNGENVYSGFVSPKWIPDKKSKIRFQYDIQTNNYSNKAVGYRKVNMMYFKNSLEAVDYYTRGFRLVKNRI